MTTEATIDIFLKAGILVVAVCSFINSRRNSTALKRVEEGVNGQTAKLLKVTGEAEHAKGVKQEHDREK